MEASQFKTLLGSVAKAHGFTAAGGGWYRQTPAAFFILNLQKSNFGNYFELNLKLFLGIELPGNPTDLKKLVKSQSGDAFRRQPEEYRSAFDLDSALADSERRNLFERLFHELVDRIASASVDPAGILRLRDEGVIYLLPMVEARLKAG